MSVAYQHKTRHCVNREPHLEAVQYSPGITQHVLQEPRQSGSETHSKQVYIMRKETKRHNKTKQKLLVVAGKLELSLCTELTMGDKDEKIKVKIFTVSLGIEGQDTSEMLLPGIIPETLE